MTEHPSLLVPKKPEVAVPENVEDLKAKLAEFQKLQQERRSTLTQLSEAIDGLTVQDQELAELEKRLLALIVKKLGSS